MRVAPSLALVISTLLAACTSALEQLTVFTDPANGVDSEINDFNRFGIWAISHLFPEIVTKTINRVGQMPSGDRVPALENVLL